MEPPLPGLGRLSRRGTAECPLLSLSLPRALDPPTASSRSSWLPAFCPQLQDPASGRCSKPDAGAEHSPPVPVGAAGPQTGLPTALTLFPPGSCSGHPPTRAPHG